MSDDKNLKSSQKILINSEEMESQIPSVDSENNLKEPLTDSIVDDCKNHEQCESGIFKSDEKSDTIEKSGKAKTSERESSDQSAKDNTDVIAIKSEASEEKQVNYTEFTKEELLDNLRDLIIEKPVEAIKDDVDIIKTCFYKIIKSEHEQLKKELVEQGVPEGEIEIPKDDAEVYLKELLADYKKKKLKYFDKLEEEKEENLSQKEDIIEKIKKLANGEESLNKTFTEFKELQKMWTEIGPVPNSEKNKLWNNYQLQIERFYDFIKINKELRDLDLKKNLENKIDLCEKTEDLLLETDILKAYETLQEYHNLWKDLGPVEVEKRDEIWERFSEATKKIRKTYQDHFVNLKQEREKNYAQKVALCERVESLLHEETPQTQDEWVKISEEIKEIQKLWKTIGMVPKEVNEEFNKNLQKKIDFCVQAESLKDSKEWKKTSVMFFDLQRKWKEVGQVPRKDSNNVWKRFRAACDHFFKAKEEFFSQIEEQQKENALKKKELIKVVIDFDPEESQASNINKIKQIQKDWIEIGPVSIKDKEELQQKFREEIEKLYKKLDLSKTQIDSQNYKEKISRLNQAGNLKLFTEERINIVQKIKKIEDDIRLWENNMTFFNKDAKDLLSDFTNKLDKAKEELSSLENKRKIIDVAIRELKKKKEEKNEK